MRYAPVLAGVVFGVFCFLFAFASTRRSMASAITIQPQAISPPPRREQPARSSGTAPRQHPVWPSPAALPEEDPVEPPSPAFSEATVPAHDAAVPPITPVQPQPGMREGVVSPADPWLPPADALSPPPAAAERPKRRRRAAAAPAAPPPGIPEEPVATCLVCGEVAASWAEVEGQRIGYCLKHYGSGSSAGGRAASGSSSRSGDRGRSSGEKTSVQCGGLTRSGQQCRRKTSDASGFCYQHRGG